MTLADATRAGVEQELREAMRTGQPVDWRPEDPSADDVKHGADWDANRTVAASLLAELLTNADGRSRPRALRLAGARIIGQLDLDAAELVCPLLLLDCWFAEPLSLIEAQAPSLRLPGCYLPSLFADKFTTRGNLDFKGGFTAGGVRLLGAHVGGELNLSGATLINHNGAALFADELTVEQSLFCRDGFTALGEVRLLGGHIGSSFELDGATMSNPEGFALNAETLTVKQDLYCRRGFTALGGVNLRGAHVGGVLDLSDATLINSHGADLQAQQLQAGVLFLRKLRERPKLVDLTQGQAGALVDEPASWPRRSILDGFVYDALFEDPPVSARRRLDWLASSPLGYIPQPYEQLAAVYRRAGREEDARTVAIAKQRARRRTLGPTGRLWGLLLDALVGYGYRTWLAAVWLAGLWLVGWALFDRARTHNKLVPAKTDEIHPSYHGALYALDTLLPVVDLRQQEVWVPRGWAQWWASVSIVAGWILTTAVVAALSGLLKRD